MNIYLSKVFYGEIILEQDGDTVVVKIHEVDKVIRKIQKLKKQFETKENRNG